ncbi:MAG: HAD family hydrolase [Desulfobacterota bacterium]|jgi:D-glycero-D-manno-heptose 1,7-bisphosphate phosphatase|nr:HAD family hydrolase [Thermodesulfobacteriota bacterium]
MKKPAVFIDRDGTINEQMGYVNHVSRFKILPGVPQAIRMLNRRGFRAFVVSNQSGVARGYYPMDLVKTLHQLLLDRIQEKKGKIDGIFFCPHHPSGSVPEFSRDCDCRKPKTGLIQQACSSFEIDLPRSFVVGDMCTDIELAHRAGLAGVLVKTGYGLGEIEYTLPLKTVKPAHIAEDLLDAVRWILEQAGRNKSLKKTS